MAEQHPTGMAMHQKAWAERAAEVGELYFYPDAGAPHRGGWGGGPDGSQISVRQWTSSGAELDIESCVGSHAGDSAAEFLFVHWLHTHWRGGPVSFPVHLTADRWDAPVLTAGEARLFMFIGNDERWVACRQVSPGKTVRVTATDGLPWKDLYLELIPPESVRPF